MQQLQLLFSCWMCNVPSSSELSISARGLSLSSYKRCSGLVSLFYLLPTEQCPVCNSVAAIHSSLHQWDLLKCSGCPETIFPLTIVPLYHPTTLFDSTSRLDQLVGCLQPRWKNHPENACASFLISNAEKKVPCLKMPLCDVTQGRLSRQASALPSETLASFSLFSFQPHFQKIAKQSLRSSRQLTGAP